VLAQHPRVQMDKIYVEKDYDDDDDNNNNHHHHHLILLNY
jgi:hypothetical protein